ncbi:helix-turn-helix transcriptional regulator [Sanguibacter suaedae]|uniref:Helix-turn-helix transcriptional regulator n=1 Tax=Sanguibacter suaedae TaxID=2795737 RepID=A0A934M8L7_9MICO|nr:helix-turn-helix transcriptional regulator [Sanguibacter suaedae]MBI9113713.1 helix-turn-helix transcriptional regulator [Sanguibacter suaedae]
MRARFFRARSASGLASAVQAVRTASGRTQTELAESIHSSRPTISRMERGLPTATDTLIDALTECGYELVVVPRGSRVTVAAP